jgi:gluconolactonase
MNIKRRTLLQSYTAMALTGTGMARDFNTITRYPDPDIVVLDKRFRKYRLGNTPIQRVSTGNLWAEGTAWNSVGKYLIWSDIPNNVQRRWIEDDARTTTFRNPSNNSNGNTFDYQGRQLSCEHLSRTVVRYEHNGNKTILADNFNGKPFNAPNDLVVHPDDGSIWFTDPGYGSMMNYEGKKRPLEIKEAVYRIDAKNGKVTKLTDEIHKPNGLCFSHDYKKLYVSDTGGPSPKGIKVWDIQGEQLKHGRPFCSMQLEGVGAGGADGIRSDIEGNIWASAGWVGDGYDGVHIFAPDGTRIGQIKLPEICGNLCFGGVKGNRLFMAASQSIYAVYVETRGAHIT